MKCCVVSLVDELRDIEKDLKKRSHDRSQKQAFFTPLQQFTNNL